MVKKIIKFVGDVGGIDNSYKRILDGTWLESELAGLTSDDEVKLIIHSYGGAVFEGQYMYNILKSCPAKKIAHVYGSCMSMATILSMACDKVYMCKNSLYMVHKASVNTGGNTKDVASTLELLNSVDSVAIDTYAEKTGLSKARLLKEFMTGFDKWLTPKEALKNGFIDGIKDPEKETIVLDSYSSINTGFSDVFADASSAKLKERAVILNTFIHKTDRKMDKKKTKDFTADEATLAPVKTSPENKTDKDALIASLKDSTSNLKLKLEERVNELSQLASDKATIEAKIAAIENEYKSAIDAANAEKEAALLLVSKKDEELKKQDVLNSIKIAALTLKAEFPLITKVKLESIVDNFNKRYSVTTSNGAELCIDNADTSVVSDSINDTLKVFAISNGYVDNPKRGLGTIQNISSQSCYDYSSSKDESQDIIAMQRKLNSEGFATYSDTYNAMMLNEFAGSKNNHIEVIRKLRK